MEYLCENEHVFVHAAKKITPYREKETLESFICPHCGTLKYREYKQQDVVTSVISVDLSEVDVRLKEGYVVESLYAKTATLVKRE